jgi:type VI secretion system protein ImpM
VAASEPPGAFGKLPAHGDFLALHLADDLRSGFDALVSAGLAAFRARRGEAWLEVYLTSPLWHFALDPGMLTARTVVGVMIPSVDAVGRYFPFAILTALPQPSPPLRLKLEAAAWFRAAGDLALGILEDRLTLGDLGPALAELGPPRLAPARPPPLPFAVEGAADDRLAGLLAQAGEPQAGLFWTNGSPHLPATVLAVAGRPNGALMAALFDGDWAAAGVAVVS